MIELRRSYALMAMPYLLLHGVTTLPSFQVLSERMLHADLICLVEKRSLLDCVSVHHRPTDACHLHMELPQPDYRDLRSGHILTNGQET